MTRSGSGSRTALIMSMARACAAVSLIFSWISGTSMSWRPTRIVGLSEAIGS